MKAKKNIPAFLTAAAILTGSMALAPAAAQLFAIADVEPEHTTQETAAVLTSGISHEDAFVAENDDYERWYKFTADEDGAMTLNLDHEKINSSSSGSTYWTVRLCMPDGKAISTWTSTGNEMRKTFDTIGLPAGDYYVQVTNGYSSSELPFNLTLEWIPNSDETKNDWETEYNDTSESPDVININQTYNGLLHADDDADWYTFTTTEAGEFDITFQHDEIDGSSSGSSYWTITAYQETDGKLKEFNSWNVIGSTEKTTTTTIGVPEGKYMIEVVKGYNRSSLPYEMTVNFKTDLWETEFNDDSDSADTINVNETVTGLLHADDDVDWYHFKTESDGNFNVSFNHDKIDNSSSYWTVTIYMLDGEKLKKFTYWTFDGKTEKNTIKPLGVPAGEYYIEVAKGFYQSTTPYEMTVNFTATEDTSDGWETEFNDYQEDANAISTGRAYHGRLYNSDDVDWYTFTLPQDTTMSLRFLHDKLDNSLYYWNITLYQGNSEVNSWSSTGNVDRTLTDEFEVTAGTYYVKIEPAFSNSYNEYTLTVNAGTASVDPSDPSTPSDDRLWGDINGSGAIDTGDAALILQYIAAMGAGATDLSLDQYVESLA